MFTAAPGLGKSRRSSATSIVITGQIGVEPQGLHIGGVPGDDRVTEVDLAAFFGMQFEPLTLQGYCV